MQKEAAFRPPPLTSYFVLLRLSRGPHREHFFAPGSFFLRLPDDVRRYVELHHYARAYSFFPKARRQVIVCFGEARPLVESPFVLEALPSDLSHIFGLHRLAVQQAVELADVFQARLQELAEARRVAYRVHQLRLSRRLRELVFRHAGLDHQPGRVVGAHWAAGVSHAGRLERARVPRGDGLSLHDRHPGVVEALAHTRSAVTNGCAEVRPAADIGEELLHSLRIAPFELPGIHEHSNRRACLDRVNADLIAKPVKVCDLLPAIDPAVRTEQGERLELERRR